MSLGKAASKDTHVANTDFLSPGLQNTPSLFGNSFPIIAVFANTDIICNRYEVRGETAVIFCPGPQMTLHEVLVDVDVLPKVLQAGFWRVANFYPRGFRLYAYRRVKGDKKRGGTRHVTLYLHRFVSGAQGRMEADHRNHNSLDNRRCNLPVVTHQENLNNRVDYSRKQREL